MTGRFSSCNRRRASPSSISPSSVSADTARCPPEQGPFGLELKPLDLLAHRRLRQVEPLRGTVETAAIDTATNERSNSNSIMGD